MAKNMDSVMTWKKDCEEFESVHLQVNKEVYEQDGRIDECTRSESGNNYTNFHCKEGKISDWQYENWTHPACCS